jgi:hypothetical protein
LDVIYFIIGTVVILGMILYLGTRSDPYHKPLSPPPTPPTRPTIRPASSSTMWQSTSKTTLEKMSVADLNIFKQQVQQTRQYAASDPGMDELEKMIEEVIEDSSRTEEEKAEAERQQLSAQTDDVCPECGETFALTDDYICAKCRARLG